MQKRIVPGVYGRGSELANAAIEIEAAHRREREKLQRLTELEAQNSASDSGSDPGGSGKNYIENTGKKRSRDDLEEIDGSGGGSGGGGSGINSKPPSNNDLRSIQSSSSLSNLNLVPEMKRVKSSTFPDLSLSEESIKSYIMSCGGKVSSKELFKVYRYSFLLFYFYFLSSLYLYIIFISCFILFYLFIYSFIFNIFLIY